MSITMDEIKKVAKLSRIKLNDGDDVFFQQQLNSIFNWINDLKNVDVSQVDLNVDCNSAQMIERADIVTAPNRVQEVLSNAPSTQHEMFAVPKVVE